MLHSRLRLALNTGALATAIAAQSAIAEMPKPYEVPKPYNAPGAAPRKEGPNSVIEELKAYYACNAKQARIAARQEGDPVSLGIAARGMCQREYGNLWDALLRVRGPGSAESLLNYTRKLVLEKNAAAIVSERSDAMSRQACEDTKNHDLAVQSCTDLIGRNPRDLTAFVNRGIGFEKKGDYPRAIADFTQAIEINPTEPISYGMRGKAYARSNDHNRAIADQTKVIELNPTYMKGAAYEYRAQSFAEVGDHDRAILDFTKAIEIKPGDTRFFGRGMVYYDKNEYGRAIVDFTKAIETSPENVSIYYVMRANAFRGVGDDERASRDYRIALNIHVTE